MSARIAAWVVGALALAVVLSLVAPGLVFLAAVTLGLPVAVVTAILTERRADGRPARDAPQRVVSAAAALTDAGRTSPDGAGADWGAALRAELASITAPRERRRFALGAALAMLGAPARFRSGLLAIGAALVFAAGLLGYSRVALGHGGLGSVTVLLPPVMLFAIGFVCARTTRSLRFGVETGVLAAVMTLAAVAVVFGVEAVRWFDVAHVSVLDGDHVDVGTSRAAVLDAVDPIILLVHLLFWLPWPVVGALAGVRAQRRGTPPARSS
jgi:hypothetical protein